jgi:hypothetical protein
MFETSNNFKRAKEFSKTKNREEKESPLLYFGLEFPLPASSLCAA